LPLVTRLYTESFTRKFELVESLEFPMLDWGDAEVVQLAKVLGAVPLPRLRELDLEGNPFGPLGLKALADVTAGGVMPNFSRLYVGLVDKMCGETRSASGTSC
jgi:hypothetical protein